MATIGKLAIQITASGAGLAQALALSTFGGLALATFGGLALFDVFSRGVGALKGTAAPLVRLVRCQGGLRPLADRFGLVLGDGR